ncbi:MAG: hypothetical protein ABUT39_24555 [Acidobacteriota bacterium]
MNSDMGGKPLKLRYTEVQESPTFYTYQAEASVDGGPWTTRSGVGHLTGGIGK